MRSGSAPARRRSTREERMNKHISTLGWRESAAQRLGHRRAGTDRCRPIRRSSRRSNRRTSSASATSSNTRRCPTITSRLGDEEIRRHRQAAAGQGPAAEGAAGLQDRQHARRHRRLRRHHAPRHRRPAAGLELPRRQQPGLGRHRHRHVRVPDPHRSAVHDQGRRAAADAEPRQELGMVGGRLPADHAPGRRRQVVRRRAVHLRRRHVHLGRQHRRSERHAGGRHHRRNLRRGHEARGARRLHDPLDLQAALRDAVPVPDGLRQLLPQPGAYPQAPASQVQQRTRPTRPTRTSRRRTI